MGANARAAATPSAVVLAGIGIAAVIGYAAYRGMDIASFASFMAAMMLSYQSIRSLSNLYTALSEGSAAAARTFALLDTPSTIRDEGNAGRRSPDQVRVGRCIFNQYCREITVERVVAEVVYLVAAPEGESFA